MKPQLADCGTGKNDSRLRIEAKAIHFYESSGQIIIASDRGLRRGMLVSRLQGEGALFYRGHGFVAVRRRLDLDRYRVGQCSLSMPSNSDQSRLTARASGAALRVSLEIGIYVQHFCRRPYRRRSKVQRFMTTAT